MDESSKSLGIIIPPPEIKAVVDKTAQFVGKNGRAFEQKILNNAQGKTAKFNFMNPSDPFNAYYEAKIREVQTGEKPEEIVQKVEEKPAPAPQPTAPVPEEAKKVVASAGKATLNNPIAVLAQKDPTPPLTPYQFLLNYPGSVTPLQDQIIKLTAQYTAVNGRMFLTKLASRETQNKDFDFLKPTHLLFSYFTLLVDSYSKLVSLSPELTQTIKNRRDPHKLLEETVGRWNYKHYEEQKKREEGQKGENMQEKLAFYAIDWNDFTVVETIDFGLDELLDVDLIGERGTQASASEADDTQTQAPTQKSNRRMEEDEDDEVIKVVSDYKPRLATQKTATPMMVMDPVSKKLIDVNQLDEHMRVQLLDPKWREEQKRFQEKHKDTALAQGDAIAENLRNFAKKRGDIFGQTLTGENSASAIASAEEEARKKAAEQPQWDGYNFVKPIENPVSVPTPPIPAPPAFPPSTYPTLSLSTPPVPVLPTYNLPPVPVPPMANPYYPPPLQMTPLVPGSQGLPLHMTPVGYPPAPPSYEDESAMKKPRLDSDLIPAEEFLRLNPNPFPITISVPSDFVLPNNESLPATFTLEATGDLSIKTLKERLSTTHLYGLAPSKFQLKSAKVGFLKDASTFAALNISTHQTLEISLKVRGGKR